MKVEVDVLGSPSLIVRTVSVTVKQHNTLRAQELCESRGGRLGIPTLVPNSPYGLCGREATQHHSELRSCVEVVVLGSLPIVPNSQYGHCGRKTQSSGAV